MREGNKSNFSFLALRITFLLKLHNTDKNVLMYQNLKFLGLPPVHLVFAIIVKTKVNSFELLDYSQDE